MAVIFSTAPILSFGYKQELPGHFVFNKKLFCRHNGTTPPQDEFVPRITENDLSYELLPNLGRNAIKKHAGEINNEIFDAGLRRLSQDVIYERKNQHWEIKLKEDTKISEEAEESLSLLTENYKKPAKTGLAALFSKKETMPVWQADNLKALKEISDTLVKHFPTN